MNHESGENGNEGMENPFETGNESAETTENAYGGEVPADDPDAFRKRKPKDDGTVGEQGLAPGGEVTARDERLDLWLTAGNTASKTAEAGVPPEEQERPSQQELDSQAWRAAAAGVQPARRVLDSDAGWSAEQGHGAPPSRGQGRRQDRKQDPGQDLGMDKDL
ncbi:hypothetical protein ACFVFI_19660 [Streptomyces sp. NPDC057705]|uniref:hypothetical protein n=1 Tax=Streptomyces sp. NPDC057705 TaxID=3346222 RepID=UPI003682E1E2